jgi:hypothetical protein
MTLYNLTGEYKKLFDMLMELDELVADDDGDLQSMEDIESQRRIIKDTLEGITGEIETKADGYVAIMKEIEKREMVARSEATEWARKADAYKRHHEYLKSALAEALRATGHDDTAGLDTGTYKIKLVGNGGQRPIWVTEDMDKIPGDYVRIKKEPDKTAIREWLETLPAGTEIPWAKLMPRGQHLSIK